MEAITKHFDVNTRLTGWPLLWLVWVIFFEVIVLFVVALAFLFLILTVVLTPNIHDTLIVTFLVLFYGLGNFVLIIVASFMGGLRKLHENEKRTGITQSQIMTWVGWGSTKSYVFHSLVFVMFTLAPLLYVIIEVIVALRGNVYWTILETHVKTFVIILWVGIGIMTLLSILNQWIISYLVVGWERLIIKLRLSLKKIDGVY